MIRISFHFSIHIYKNGNRIGKQQTAPTRDSRSFAQVARETVKRLEISKGKSTTDNYHTALRSFLAYAGQELTINELSQDTVEGWQQWLQTRGVRLNTISCYIRSLRSIINHGDMEVNAGKVFDTVFTGNTKTDKRSISAENLRRIQELPLEASSPLCFARDIFLFSVYALGMPFVDVAFLRKSQIADGYIAYQRHKNCRPIRIKIEPPMQQIIDRYNVENSLYVFPILSKGTIREYQTARGDYNRKLRKLANAAGLRHLTSYVARHSWASMAYKLNVDLPVISKALGHTSSDTTMVYIREIDDDRIDDANRRLLAHIVR